MAIGWSEKTKNSLIAVDDAITRFVLEKWQYGMPVEVSNAWVNFVKAEAEDLGSQGFAKKNWVQNAARGFRDIPYTLVSDVSYMKSLSKENSDLRARIYNDVGVLLQNFAPWDMDDGKELPRKYVDENGLMSSPNANRIRFRVLDEQASIDKQIAEKNLSDIEKKAKEKAAELGIDISQSAADIIKNIYAKNTGLFIAGGVGILVAIMYFAYRSRKR